MTTPFDLGDKVAIVGGSSRGIGRGSAEAVARLGGRVVVSELQGRRVRSGGRAVFASPAGRRRSFLAISRTKTRPRRSWPRRCVLMWWGCPPPCTNRQG